MVSYCGTEEVAKSGDIVLATDCFFFKGKLFRREEKSGEKEKSFGRRYKTYIHPGRNAIGMIDVVREEGYRENPSMQEQTDTHITPYHLKSLLVPTQLIRLGKCEYMESFARG